MDLYRDGGKRVLDLLLASLALLFALPAIALAAAAIRLDSEGPVFHRATRVGRGGKKFTFLKLRSMQVGAEELRGLLLHLNQAQGAAFKLHNDLRGLLLHLNQAQGAAFKLHNDPRVTRVGRFLRKTSLDELPQLWHVLEGHMSLVGPRPPFPEEVEKYEPWMLKRLSVRPGLTCLWQIQGRSDLPFEEWMRLDIEYVDRCSLALDLRILVLTIPAVLSARGAY